MSKPEKIFKVGPVRASVFGNPVQQGDRSFILRKVVLEVRYKDKSGQWKGTNSFSLNDLPKAVLALQSAYAYLLEQGAADNSSSQSLSSQEEQLDSPSASYTVPGVSKPSFQRQIYKAT
jgi:hypothetical protein